MNTEETKATGKRRVINMKDRRVRKTVKSLRDALIELLETKNINDITVSELTAAADVNRSTFYFYYDDINDMVQQLQNEIYDIFYETVVKPNNDLGNVEDYLAYVTRFFEFCRDNAVQCRFLITNDINRTLYDKILADVRAHIPDSSKEFAKDKPEHYLTTYVIMGITGIILQWLDDGMQVSPEEMAKFIGANYAFGVAKVLKLSF